MLKLLTQPFPSTTNIVNRIRTAFVYGSFVFLFLLIFKPFGLQAISTSSRLIAASLYGLVCFLTLVACFLSLPLLFPTFYQEKNWIVWKEILHTIGCVTLVAAANIAFTHWWYRAAFGPQLVLEFLFNTFTVSTLPIVVLVLLRQMRLMRTYTREAHALDRQVAPLPPAQPNPPSPQTDVLLYAQSADNYVRIFSIRNGAPTRNIVRTTLKNLEESYQHNDAVFRCHRAYIVNLTKVIHVTGNAQGYKLHLEDVEDPIPVSRNLNKEITARIARVSNHPQPIVVPITPIDPAP